MTDAWEDGRGSLGAQRYGLDIYFQLQQQMIVGCYDDQSQQSSSPWMISQPITASTSTPCQPYWLTAFLLLSLASILGDYVPTTTT